MMNSCESWPVDTLYTSLMSLRGMISVALEDSRLEIGKALVYHTTCENYVLETGGKLTVVMRIWL